MEKPELAKFEMINVTTKSMEKYADKFTNVSIILERLAGLKSVSERILLYEGKLKNSTAGKTDSKNVTKDDLIRISLIVTAGLYGYGIDSKDSEARELGDMVVTDFNRMRQSEIPAKAKTILAKATSLGGSIEKYGVGPDELTELETTIASFLGKMSDMGAGSSDQGSARDTLDGLFDEANLLLDSLDKLMIRFETKEPELYSTYKAARVIRDKAVSHRDTEVNEPQ